MIQGFFKDTLTRIRKTEDEFGQMVPSRAEYRCRIERKDGVRLNINGQDAVTQYRVFASPLVDIQEGDYVILGSVGTGETPREIPVLSVERLNGFSASHLEILL